MVRARPRRPPTGRAIVLGAIVAFLAILLAAPIHRYLESRSAVQQAAQQLAGSQTQLAQLQRERAQWQDPSYVQQQARARLQYAMPGDTVYVLVTPGQQPALGGQPAAPASPPRLSGGSWNRRLWGSVLTADSAP
jgi:cell division protein FtsB